MPDKSEDKIPNKGETTPKGKGFGSVLGKGKPSMPKVPVPKSSWRGFLIYAILGLLLFAFFAFTSAPTTRFLPSEPLSRAINDIKENKVENIRSEEHTSELQPQF